MKQGDLSELRRLILKLVRRIATVNRAHPSARVGDIVWLQGRKPGSRYPHAVDTLRLGQDDSTWVTVERDTRLWNDVIDKLHMPRKSLISRRFVETELIGLVENHRRKGWRLQGIYKSINQLLDNITTERGEEYIVFLPIMGLVLYVKEFEVGDVKFIDRAELREIDDKLQKMESEPGKYGKFSMPKTIAVTKAIGDRETALQNARQKVNQTLNIFRAFVYPTVESRGATRRQIGVMGEYPASVRLSYYMVKSGVSTTGKIGVISEGYGLLGVGEMDVTDRLLEQLSRVGFNRLSGLLTSSPSPFDSALLRAAEWLGEATKPDKLETKFLKVAFAIDAMLGEEPSEHIPDKGIAARIGERSVFLLSNKGQERRVIYDEIYELIRKRNSLAHGGSDKVDESETEKFGTYARTLLTKLLNRQPPFKSTNELAEWVQRQSLRG